MAGKKVEIENDGPDEIVRIDGIIIGRLTGEGSNRHMHWREGQDLDGDKVVAFDKAFAEGDRSPAAIEKSLREAGLA